MRLRRKIWEMAYENIGQILDDNPPRRDPTTFRLLILPVRSGNFTWPTYDILTCKLFETDYSENSHNYV